MSLRLVEAFLPQSQEQSVREFLEPHPFVKSWYVSLPEEQILLKILLHEGQVEPVVDCLAQKFGDLDGFRLLLLPVEASLPQPEPEKLEPDVERQKSSRIYREEIYLDIAQSISLNRTEILLVILSTIIAAIGLLRGSEVIVIGAMVVAPLLKPNMALGLATTLGDISLGRKSLIIGLMQILIALALSILLGIFVSVDLSNMSEVALRTRVDLSDIALAFASGVAGAISFTTGEKSAVVGVMVSVALLPPLVVLGILIGSGLWFPALGATVLVSTNIVCLNLAAIATFWIQDVRPQEWWQNNIAKKITRVASIIWLLLLTILIGLIFIVKLGYK
ncbi:TIGR00341 family protein [Mastigocoleus sp. MO_188.B34]|uniref:TIGR00341 family protein n=1 Tax=Mastigocoleus sp. MO_188.B34 TaxID=3036635 RepID=UPI00262162D4|nr:TIGR00341 family protein [Mastigocoleus sp. MO_188.B34]MDJ0695883.1 TIGR00341 family protein [Mastigocoleus sp. MO_188.B34]